MTYVYRLLLTLGVVSVGCKQSDFFGTVEERTKRNPSAAEDKHPDPDQVKVDRLRGGDGADGSDPLDPDDDSTRENPSDESTDRNNPDDTKDGNDEELDDPINSSEGTVSIDKRADLIIVGVGKKQHVDTRIRVRFVAKNGDGDWQEVAWPKSGETRVRNICSKLDETEIEIEVKGGEYQSWISIPHEDVKKRSQTGKQIEVGFESTRGCFLGGLGEDCHDDAIAKFYCEQEDLYINGL